jgi:hypothetical protein
MKLFNAADLLITLAARDQVHEDTSYSIDIIDEDHVILREPIRKATGSYQFRNADGTVSVYAQTHHIALGMLDSNCEIDLGLDSEEITTMFELLGLEDTWKILFEKAQEINATT